MGTVHSNQSFDSLCRIRVFSEDGLCRFSRKVLDSAGGIPLFSASRNTSFATVHWVWLRWTKEGPLLVSISSNRLAEICTIPCFDFICKAGCFSNVGGPYVPGNAYETYVSNTSLVYPLLYQLNCKSWTERSAHRISFSSFFCSSWCRLLIGYCRNL